MIFANNLAIIRKKPTKDAVHDLRVSVKKIRSYLRLQQKITGEGWIEQFAPIKLLFSTLGKLRDFEMSLLLLKKYQRKEEVSLPDFKQYLQVNRSLTRQWTKEAVKNFNTDELDSVFKLNKSLSPFTNEELESKIKQYSTETLDTVIVLASNFKKEAHEIRKQLKDVYYWLIICPNNLVGKFIEIKDLDNILSALGEWQDNFIFHEKLKYFRKELLSKKSNEAEIAETIEKEINKKKDELLNKAIHVFQSFFEK